METGIMGVIIKDNITNKIKKLPDLIKSEAEKALAQMVISAHTEMIERTRQGKDKENKPFKAYKKSYKTFKEQAGKPSSPVNLTFTGDMLKALQARTRREGDKIIGTIDFRDKDQVPKALQHINGDGVKQRDFFGIGKSLQARLIKKFKDQININTIIKKA